MELAPIIYRTSRPAPDLAHHEVLSGVYVIGGSVDVTHVTSQTNTAAILGVHGCGTIDGTLVWRTQDAERVGAMMNATSWAHLGERIRGSLTLYLLDEPRGTIAVLPDPLGAGVVFTFRDQDSFAVSSDLQRLSEFLAGRGKRISRSAGYSACLIATGSGGIFPSSYEGIDALDHFQYVLVKADGVEIRDYPLKNQLFQSRISYDECLQEVKDEVVQTTMALLAAPHVTKICHLTDGFDSRLLLAGIRALGGEDSFRFFCLKSPAVDRKVAEGLAATLGLTMTEYSGADWEVLPGSLEEQILGPLVRSAGILPGAPDIGMKSAGSLILQGGYGEFYRTFFSTDMTEAVASGGRALAARMWSSRGYPAEGESGACLFSDFFAEVARRVDHSIEAGTSMGLRPDAIPDFLFMRYRNRYFMGTQSREWSAIGSQIDPLYGHAALPVAYAMDFETRTSNIFGFDLLNLLDDQLIKYPYATQAFNWKYQQLRPVPETHSFAATSPHFDDRRAPQARRRSGGSVPVATAEQISRADSMRVPSGRVAQSD